MILLEGLKRVLLVLGGTLAVLRGVLEVGHDEFLMGGLVLLGLYLVACGLQGKGE